VLDGDVGWVLIGPRVRMARASVVSAECEPRPGGRSVARGCSAPQLRAPDVVRARQGHPRRGHRLTPGLRTIFRYRRSKADIPAGHPHALRHAVGPHWARRGWALWCCRRNWGTPMSTPRPDTACRHEGQGVGPGQNATDRNPLWAVPTRGRHAFLPSPGTLATPVPPARKRCYKALPRRHRHKPEVGVGRIDIGDHLRGRPRGRSC